MTLYGAEEGRGRRETVKSSQVRRSEVRRSEMGRSEMGRSEMGRSEMGRSEMGRSEVERSSAIASIAALATIATAPASIAAITSLATTHAAIDAITSMAADHRSVPRSAQFEQISELLVDFVAIASGRRPNSRRNKSRLTVMSRCKRSVEDTLRPVSEKPGRLSVIRNVRASLPDLPGCDW